MIGFRGDRIGIPYSGKEGRDTTLELKKVDRGDYLKQL